MVIARVPLSTHVRRAAGLTLAAALGLSFVACGKTMSSQDCERVGKHLREVWDDEASAAAGAGKDKSERAENAIRAEGDRMVGEWLSQCRRELEGRPVDQKEVDCMLGAKNVSDIQQCAAPARR